MDRDGDQQLQLYSNGHSFSLQRLSHSRKRRHIPPRPDPRRQMSAQGRQAGAAEGGRQVFFCLVATHRFLAQEFQR